MHKTPVALITGGARGIGESISRLLAENGHTPVINYFRSQERAERLEEDLRLHLLHPEARDVEYGRSERRERPESTRRGTVKAQQRSSSNTAELVRRRALEELEEVLLREEVALHEELTSS